MSHPAGPTVRLDTPGAATAVSPPHPRPRQQVHPRLRRSLRQRRNRDHQDAGASAEGERVRRTLRPHRPRRMPRLATNREPPPPRTRAPHLRRPLQQPQAAPVTRSQASRSPGSPAADSALAHSPRRAPRPTRRTTPRIQPRRMKPSLRTTQPALERSELSRVRCRTLVIFADDDLVSMEHAVATYEVRFESALEHDNGVSSSVPVALSSQPGRSGPDFRGATDSSHCESHLAQPLACNGRLQADRELLSRSARSTLPTFSKPSRGRHQHGYWARHQPRVRRRAASANR